MTGRYRPDIDGLRAIAVLAVVFYHAGTPFVPGGFVGVDIFFVISGFVIATSLKRDLDEGRFSIGAFYERRVRRIFPALLLVFAVSFVVARILLLPDAFTGFAASLFSASAFYSNVYFWRASGYFDTSAHLLPLLHTWSLAVEEQFYILMPLAIFVIHRFGRSRWTLFLLPIAMASLLLSAYAVETAPKANFFLLPTRAWELLAGVLAALSTLPALTRRFAEIAAATGLALIAYALVFYSETTPFPGPSALAPCLGSLLLIVAGSNNQTVVNRQLSFRPLVAVGLISYSLYLVHWPIFVFARYATLRNPTLAESAGLIAVSVMAAAVSWRFVEQPFRYPKPGTGRSIALGSAAAAMAAALLAGLIGPKLNGIPPVSMPAVQTADATDIWKSGQCFLIDDLNPARWDIAACTRTTGKSRNLLLWGDSFAAHYTPGLLANAKVARVNVIQYTAAGCPPVLSYYSYARPGCQTFNRFALELIKRQNIGVVVLAARWTDIQQRGLDSIRSTLVALEATGVQVFLIGQSTEFLTDVNVIAARNSGNRQHAQSWQIAFDARINRALKGYAGQATFIDPLDFLCHGDECPYAIDGKFLYYDYGHFTPFGSARAVAAYFPFMQAEQAAAVTTGATP
jgi:peptidoglycan/LPS O-acetylase OafA/YrhL